VTLEKGWDSGTRRSASRCGDQDNYLHFTVSLDEPYPLNALQVCRNSLNKRVKGVELQGRRIEIDEETGEIDFRERNAATEKGLGCHKWMEFVSCGVGQLASGIHAHFASAPQGEHKLVGLRLICRDVVGVYE